MKGIKKKITILWGLPASGKTTYGKSQLTYAKRIIDLDAIGESKSGPAFFDAVAKAVLRGINADEIILDGLIVDNISAQMLMATIGQEVKNYDLVFSIVWWRPDVEACLHNDLGRRDVHSQTTIKNIKFEKPDANLLGIPASRVTAKDVFRKPAHVVWAEKHMHPDDAMSGKLTSERWSLGGTWVSYTGSRGNVEADVQPSNFDEFDKLMEQICPTINFLQYKKAYRESVKVEEEEDSDCYGGRTTHAKFVCDLSKLYDILKEMGVEL